MENFDDMHFSFLLEGIWLNWCLLQYKSVDRWYLIFEMDENQEDLHMITPKYIFKWYNYKIYINE